MHTGTMLASCTFVARAAETSVTGESISLEITIHELFTRLSNRFHQSFMIFLKVFFQIFRNIARLLACFVDISSTYLLHNIHITDKLAISSRIGKCRGAIFLP